MRLVSCTAQNLSISKFVKIRLLLTSIKYLTSKLVGFLVGYWKKMTLCDFGDNCAGGAVASWSVRLSTDRAVRVQALAGDTVLCSWARHFALTVPLSTQEYKWVPVLCWGNLTNCWGVTCDGLASRPGGVEILLAASCCGNRDKLRPDEPVGSIRLHFTVWEN